ncbi:DUF2459 domain-containing protein [Jannaschia sp. M317]|uniref:DUF2459 domain-containing protein n=1 Tax=Jannaschia sp. M317 TaxID=2867011 RepID=UPI0021A41707|nr:DUF2459 domain-containing protein [Jannaschia sp. M317]UWQ18470.1 DUF2459 domain-containing protein [Jannaschia sp. M317]
MFPALIALWFGTGLVGALLPAAGEVPGDDVAIRLIGTAIHYDILLPATPEARAKLAFAGMAGVPIDAPGAEWILVGWGARDFYTATGTYADMRPGPVWRAVTGDHSVLRVEVLGALDTADLPEVRLSAAQFTRLLGAVAGTRSGPVVPGAGFTATDAFFEADGRFHLNRTCNVWVGEMLRAAGLRFGRWTPTPQAVRLHG